MPNTLDSYSAKYEAINEKMLEASVDAHEKTTKASMQQQALQADSQAAKSQATAIADQAKKIAEVADEFKF